MRAGLPAVGVNQYGGLLQAAPVNVYPAARYSARVIALKLGADEGKLSVCGIACTRGGAVGSAVGATAGAVAVGGSCPAR